MYWISQVALVLKNLPANAGDTGLIPGSGRSPGEGERILQYSCLKNSMGRGAWRAIVHGTAKSQTGLSTMHIFQFSSIQSLSCVQLFATPWTAAFQASLSITNSQSPPKPMSIESVMPSNHLILCHPILLLPSIFPVFSNESALRIRWPNFGVSASTSVLPMNTQDWFPLGWTGWISLQSNGLSRVFSNTTIQKHQFFYTQLSL